MMKYAYLKIWFLSYINIIVANAKTFYYDRISFKKRSESLLKHTYFNGNIFNINIFIYIIKIEQYKLLWSFYFWTSINLSPIRTGLFFQGDIREICVSQTYFVILILSKSAKSVFFSQNLCKNSRANSFQ